VIEDQEDNKRRGKLEISCMIAVLVIVMIVTVILAKGFSDSISESSKNSKKLREEIERLENDLMITPEDSY
jgi:hypothetical protein